MFRHVAAIYSDVSEAWCHLTHPEPMWPINGHYVCPKCLREYPVAWANGAARKRTDPGDQDRLAA